MKKICLLMAFLIPLAMLKAQDKMTPKEKITQVLQSEEEFLYADQTCATVEQALERAQTILMLEVEAYLKQSGEDGEVVKGTVTEQMVTITVQRGDKYRAFVYINKANLGTEVQDSLSTEIPVVEEIVTQKADTTMAIVPEPSLLASEALTQIAAMTSRLQVYDYICHLQKDGAKISFIEHPNVNEQDSMYLILYKRGGKIEAILTPTDGQGVRHNLATGQPDSKNNHPATSVNGFKYEQ